jgi:hypothetical protein
MQRTEASLSPTILFWFGFVGWGEVTVTVMVMAMMRGVFGRRTNQQGC